MNNNRLREKGTIGHHILFMDRDVNLSIDNYLFDQYLNSTQGINVGSVCILEKMPSDDVSYKFQSGMNLYPMIPQ